MLCALQFIAAYDATASDPEKVKIMKTRSFRGDWSRFSTVAIIEMAAATAELQANGVALVGDGREQAAAYLEQKRLHLGQTMASYFRGIASGAAVKNRIAALERAAPHAG